MHYQRIILILFCSLAVSLGYAEEEWGADEIFLQMSEMRKEIQQLQQKVAGLEQKLAEQQPKPAPIALKGSKNITLVNRMLLSLYWNFPITSVLIAPNIIKTFCRNCANAISTREQ